MQWPAKGRKETAMEQESSTKKLVIYYSYGGSTKALAEEYAQEQGADVYQVDYQKRPSMLGVIFSCPGVIAQKQAKKLKPIAVDFAKYEDITVMGPIYAGHPAKPVNNILYALPKGTAVHLRMVSSGGDSNREKVTQLVELLDCTVAEYEDVKAPGDGSTATE